MHVNPRVKDLLILGERWTPLKFHQKQQDLWNSEARFIVLPAGRRSGKTELAKRKLILRALQFTAFSDGWFVFAAPTYPQAKRIFWADLKKLVPAWAVSRIFESELTIRLVTGTEITVLGMDQPERAEGRPLDGIVLDEYADMKPTVWTQHIRAALSTIGRPGWAWFTGVPEGRNHYYDLYTKALSDTTGKWEGHTWKSAEILDPEEIEAAKGDMDALSYQQEYEASFVNFEGRVYHEFDRLIHAKKPLKYNPKLPLMFAFDFNVKPGVAVVCQEQMVTIKGFPTEEPVTCAIGEVWIPDNSNTPMVCRKLVYDWGHHRGDVLCYGDATGGARGTARVEGSDWALIEKTLRPEFGSNLKMRYRRQNPKERSRINAMNTRIKAADGTMRVLTCPHTTPHQSADLEGVKYVKGGAGEIDKDADAMATHISDAIGYLIEKRHPVEGNPHISSTEA